MGEGELLNCVSSGRCTARRIVWFLDFADVSVFRTEHCDLETGSLSVSTISHEYRADRKTDKHRKPHNVKCNIYACVDVASNIRVVMNITEIIFIFITCIIIRLGITPTNAHFHSLCSLSVSSYMFRHFRHPQGADTNMSLKHTAVHNLQ